MADESLQEKVEWKPTTQQLLIMVVLSVISFMVSLDATIIVTSLNVSALPSSLFMEPLRSSQHKRPPC